ncbi:MAG: symmetrical bis(5'-nucleosyl)-tetraphosphatase [Candidatus Eutrophobiaceae bacterium]
MALDLLPMFLRNMQRQLLGSASLILEFARNRNTAIGIDAQVRLKKMFLARCCFYSQDGGDMATWVIGDLQGCYDELMDLLEHIRYDPAADRLWFCGDLINRGPRSLECLEFVVDCPQARTVLGNHDLHLLAVAAKVRKEKSRDTLSPVLRSDKCERLLDWLRRQPLMAHDPQNGFYLVHAGLYPQWSVEDALRLAQEASASLQGEAWRKFAPHMYGGKPRGWSAELQGNDRIRCIVNGFTRMRYLDADGNMDHHDKGAPGSQRQGLIPWYRHPDRRSSGDKLVFGHWSTVTLGVRENFQRHLVWPVDTGCLWGGRLTALRLEDQRTVSVKSRTP